MSWGDWRLALRVVSAWDHPDPAGVLAPPGVDRILRTGHGSVASRRGSVQNGALLKPKR